MYFNAFYFFVFKNSLVKLFGWRVNIRMLLKMLKYYCSKMVCIHLMISKYSSIVHFDKLNSLDDGCSRVGFRV